MKLTHIIQVMLCFMPLLHCVQPLSKEEATQIVKEYEDYLFSEKTLLEDILPAICNRYKLPSNRISIEYLFKEERIASCLIDEQTWRITLYDPTITLLGGLHIHSDDGTRMDIVLNSSLFDANGRHESKKRARLLDAYITLDPSDRFINRVLSQSLFTPFSHLTPDYIKKDKGSCGQNLMRNLMGIFAQSLAWENTKFKAGIALYLKITMQHFLNKQKTVRGSIDHTDYLMLYQAAVYAAMEYDRDLPLVTFYCINPITALYTPLMADYYQRIKKERVILNKDSTLLASLPADYKQAYDALLAEYGNSWDNLIQREARIKAQDTSETDETNTTVLTTMLSQPDFTAAFASSAPFILTSDDKGKHLAYKNPHDNLPPTPITSLTTLLTYAAHTTAQALVALRRYYDERRPLNEKLKIVGLEKQVFTDISFHF